MILRMMENGRPESYILITDEQKASLVSLYEGGMVSTLEIEKMKTAAEKTGLSIQRIKKWIGNWNARKRKSRENEKDGERNREPVVKRPKGDRKLTAKNVFYARLSKEGKLVGFKSNKERHLFVHEAWMNMNLEEKRGFEEEARRINENDTEEMNENEKQEMIKKYKKRLLNDIAVLEQLGVENSCIMLDEQGGISFFGSKRGTDFLASCGSLDFEFKKFFDIKESNQNKHSYKDLQDVFNKAYAKAISCQGAKVPYLKGNFSIEGIPDGVEWKKKDGKIRKPCEYGQKAVARIMAVKEDIKFIISNDESQEEDNVIEFENHSQPNVEIANSVLKLVDYDIVKRVLSGGAKIQETEVDVMTLLRKEEYNELFGYSNLFTDEALEAVKKNFFAMEKGTLVATYTKNPKKFWLFYYSGNADDIGKLNGRQLVPGLWLDQIKGTKYKVLHDAVSITSVNIIKTQNNNIIYHQIMINEQTNVVKVPETFLSQIRERLNELRP